MVSGRGLGCLGLAHATHTFGGRLRLAPATENNDTGTAVVLGFVAIYARLRSTVVFSTRPEHSYVKFTITLAVF
ncbi:hypothetical protein NPX13_g9120 [Xylaria arbuscula]|uniref:Uncharacterized protein n=1 Tax=Xylaria arbuscula TaxID=114810 RepID=A0A9W8N7F9_9PEZI|nr:hypothetical protein NPX13_g9120 [Xylaria arbuscula]